MKNKTVKLEDLKLVIKYRQADELSEILSKTPYGKIVDDIGLPCEWGGNRIFKGFPQQERQ